MKVVSNTCTSACVHVCFGWNKYIFNGWRDKSQTITKQVEYSLVLSIKI